MADESTPYRAARDEDEPLVVHLGGRGFPVLEATVDVLNDLLDGHLDTFSQRLLGPKFGIDVTTKDIDALSDELADCWGFESTGKCLASSSSSATSGTRSRPTSSGTTAVTFARQSGVLVA